MIVREAGEWLWLVTQPDHAALAADLMSAWRADGLPDRPTREAALFATARHDLGWIDYDREPAVDATTGRPFDFMSAPVEVKQGVWRRALLELPHLSTYAAALVAQHALRIFRRFRGDAAWQDFFDAMEQARDQWFTTDVRPDATRGGAVDPPADARRTFLQDYAVVGTGDLLSLTFCNDWRSPQLTEGYAVAMIGDELRVAPDPFDGARVPFEVRARRIPHRPYRSDADLRTTLSGAEETVLAGLAVGVPELAGS
jgi:hypothetical protein